MIKENKATSPRSKTRLTEPIIRRKQAPQLEPIDIKQQIINLMSKLTDPVATCMSYSSFVGSLHPYGNPKQRLPRLPYRRSLPQIHILNYKTNFLFKGQRLSPIW